MGSPPDLRASDAERDHAVELLRRHATAGRITVEELDERCTAALGARTRGELADLLSDLPREDRVVAPPAPPSREARGIGVRPFTYESHLDVAPDKAMDAALRHIAPAMHRGRYELIERSAERLVFTYSHRPVWTWVVAFGVFPFGLIALAYTTEERIVLDFDRARGGATRLVVTGRAPRRVRRAFAELEAAR